MDHGKYVIGYDWRYDIYIKNDESYCLVEYGDQKLPAIKFSILLDMLNNILDKEKYNYVLEDLRTFIYASVP